MKVYSSVEHISIVDWTPTESPVCTDHRKPVSVRVARTYICFTSTIDQVGEIIRKYAYGGYATEEVTMTLRSSYICFRQLRINSVGAQIV